MRLDNLLDILISFLLNPLQVLLRCLPEELEIALLLLVLLLFEDVLLLVDLLEPLLCHASFSLLLPLPFLLDDVALSVLLLVKLFKLLSLSGLRSRLS